MNSLNLQAAASHFCIALLDAPDMDARQYLADQIAGDPDLSLTILLILSEQIKPLLPAPDLAASLIEELLQ